MRVVLIIATVLTLGMAVQEARGETALEAIKELPKGQAGRIARIEARDGTPLPDRWYILTQDPKADNGVHEYVVADGKVVASRAISQFAESLKPEEVVGGGAVTIDSDKAAKVAQSYADANGAVVASMNYELKKTGTDGAVAWTISCVDDKGTKVGTVVVTATKGTVVSHDGFAVEPLAAATPEETPEPKAIARLDSYAAPDETATPRPEKIVHVPAGGKTAQYAKATPAKKATTGIGKALQNVGNTLKKLDPF
jgi:hypothetical protein